MIKEVSDSQYLEMLAHWFEMQKRMGRWPNSDTVEIEENLIRIAKRINEFDSVISQNTDSSIKILGAVLKVLEVNQTELIKKINVEFSQISGLKNRTLEKYFALANKSIKSCL